MAELKTKPTNEKVIDFINQVEGDEKRADSLEILKLMESITGAKAQMWGPSIIGFGNYHYKSKSGREGDWFLTGFSPRKPSLSLYIMSGFQRYPDLMETLGKHKTGKGCLYVKRLSDIDKDVLEQLIRESVAYLQNLESNQG